jgi:hypothetical protein
MLSRWPPSVAHHAAGLATCLVAAFNRFQALISAISMTRAASPRFVVGSLQSTRLPIPNASANFTSLSSTADEPLGVFYHQGKV